MKTLSLIVFLTAMIEIWANPCREHEMRHRITNGYLNPTSYSRLICNDLVSLEEVKYYGASNRIQSAVIRNSILETVPRDSFSWFRNLLNLHLSSNRIKEIQPGAFYGLEGLEELYLGDNSVREIGIGTLNFSGRLRILDLSRNHLTKIENRTFSGLWHLETLYLSHNRLTSVNSTTFASLGSVKYLDLSYNKISDVKHDTFSNMPGLEMLFLNDNFMTNLHPGLFENTLRLRILDVSMNAIEEINFEGLPDSLENVMANNNKLFNIQDWSDLKEISIAQLERNNISNFGSVGKGITTLDLSDNDLQSLNRTVFGKCVDLLHLDLSNNSILEVETDTFGNLFRLQNLNLSRNKLQSLSGFGKSEDDWFSDSNLTESSLLFENNTELIYLDLSHNSIARVQVTTLKRLAKLKTLNLSYNHLEFLPVGCFRDLISLEQLQLSFNSISRIEYGTFSGLNNLTLLFLDNNNLTQIPVGSFYVTKELKALYLTNNALAELNVTKLVSLTKIHTIFLNGNNWTCNRLLEITQTLTLLGIGFGNGTDTDKENVYGMFCKGELGTTRIGEEEDKIQAELLRKKHSTQNENEQFKTSNFFKFFDEGFSNSTFYRFFEKDFEKSGLYNRVKGNGDNDDEEDNGYNGNDDDNNGDEDYDGNNNYDDDNNGYNDYNNKNGSAIDESYGGMFSDAGKAEKLQLKYVDFDGGDLFVGFTNKITVFIEINVALLFLLFLMFLFLLFRTNRKYKMVSDGIETI